MANIFPHINVIYFKHILENVLEVFFTIHIQEFKKENDIFVLSSKISHSKLKKELKTLIVEELKKYLKPYNVLTPNYYFMIGSCYPSDNLLLSYIKEQTYIPEKYNTMIKEGNIKYILNREGFKIDSDKFNDVFEDIFKDFLSRKNFKKYFPNNTRNLFFLKSYNLDCYMTFRILKYNYGKTTIVNIHEQFKDNMKSYLISLNDIIDEYVRGKREMIKGEKFKLINAEIKEYVDNCLSGEFK